MTATRSAGDPRPGSLTGIETRRIHVDKGYCGYNYRSLICNLVYQALIDWRAVP
jgi:hypothetical protein